MSNVSIIEQQQFAQFYNNVHAFIHSVLAGELPSLDDFINGTQRIDFFEHRLHGYALEIEDYQEELSKYGGLSYEEALYRRLLDERHANLLVLIGGLGAGKSTAASYISYLLETRREHINKKFPCKCEACRRKPILIDCVTLHPRTSSEQAMIEIARKIRFALYDQLISEWLLSHGIDPGIVKQFDRGYRVLRRLMMLNDVEMWADAEDPGAFPLDLEVGEYRIATPLFQGSPSLESIKSLVTAFQSKIDGLAERLKKVTEDPRRAVDFTVLLLNFYVSRCASRKPNSLILIDNLDQLPTDTIEEIAEDISVLAARTPGVPMILPLRPSSITPKGFERRPSCMYHYGPDCFEFILYRLQKYVLTRPLAALMEAQPNDGKPRVFIETPRSDEVYSFLVASYLYAKILAAGLGSAGTRLTGGASKVPEVHPDFAERLQSIRLSEGALRSLSETLGAVVGHCGRYATTQLERYYHCIYTQPEIIFDALRSGIAVGAPTHLHLHYSQVVTTMLFSNGGPEAPERLLNIFKPSRVGANDGWPSLVKARILDVLAREQRVSVRDLLRTLAYYGIPKELGIDGLNELHNKKRLLIWFSKNHDLTLKDPDLDQDVVISEHGVGYSANLIGDFEYLWFCASGISDQRAIHEKKQRKNFRARLNSYTALMDGIAQVEWKQLAFRQCNTAKAANESDVVTARVMLSLSILYSSLDRAIRSSQRSIGIVGEETEYRRDIASLVTRICKLILNSQERYRRCHGDTGYLLRYHDKIDRSKLALRELLRTKALADDELDVVENLITGWERTPIRLQATLNEHEIDTSSIPPKEDFITLASKYGRGLIPGLSGFVGSLDKLENVRIYLWMFLNARDKLARILAHSLPEYGIVERNLVATVAGAHRVIEAASVIAATGTQTVEWLVQEGAWLEDHLERFRANRFDIQQPASFEEMDEMKARFNNTMGVYEDIARRHGVTKCKHLEVRWS